MQLIAEDQESDVVDRDVGELVLVVGVVGVGHGSIFEDRVHLAPVVDSLGFSAKNKELLEHKLLQPPVLPLNKVLQDLIVVVGSLLLKKLVKQ